MAREHGTYSCAVTGCKNETCQEARRQYARHVRRQQAYGRWQPWVDAEPARRHVRHLKKSGLGYRRIAELSGTTGPLIFRLLHGTKSTGKPPTRSLRAATAARILAVQPVLDVIAEGAKIDATGTRRRLQALVAAGWTQSRIAEQLGMTPGTLSTVIRSARTTGKTARAVAGLYERMWNLVPPQGTALERGAVKRARAIAARYSWAPPLAWDDETIDDPAAEPEGVGRDKPSRVRKLPPADDIHWLIQGGDSVEVIAARYDTKVDAVRQSLYRNQVAA
jgi:transcriptional regulator with XRE-family HTH domain